MLTYSCRFVFLFCSIMSATLEASYQPLQPYGAELGEPDETPQDSGVIIHVVPENSRGAVMLIYH